MSHAGGLLSCAIAATEAFEDSVIGDVSSKLKHAYQRFTGFFARDIWEQRLDELPRGAAIRYLAARIAQRTFHQLAVDDTLQVRAAALTYYTMLSLVPLLAFAFALLKGFGAYELLVDDAIRPYLLELFAGNQALREAIDKILSFVEQTGVAGLGAIGLLTLFYAATRLLRNVEGALNELWGVKNGRAPLQQLRDYATIMVVTPLCLLAAVTLTTTGQVLAIVRAAGDTLGISLFLDQLIGALGPLLALFVGLLVLYKVMPYTTVRLSSAMVGAALGGVTWYLALILHVKFQVGVARFNALYSSFAALPIFLAWLYVSWTVVLVGGQVAATHQNSRALAQRTRLASVDHGLRESICIAAMLRITKSFLEGERAPGAEALGNELDVHEPLLVELLDRLVKAGLLVRAEPRDTCSYVLARSPNAMRVKDVLDALRRNPELSEQAASARVGELASQVWRDLDRAQLESDANRTLHELAERSSDSQECDLPKGTG